MFLQHVKNNKARSSLIRVRLGVSQLKVHKLRFTVNLTETDLLCPVCKSQIESEIHFILTCPVYAELREQYIAKKYYRCPSFFKLSMLLASENKLVISRLAMYIMKAFDTRNFLCQNGLN
eukprot:TRINITY_DN669_c0_g1_i9.p1 TRINITY_DN669_c0_g1~~TRINITY_DN669_c0_g1_i9.p1  ORF type:complete len:120 (-),score=12.16 TRINITY_DN669_c0_g1_i9:79-438(-)